MVSETQKKRDDKTALKRLRETGSSGTNPRVRSGSRKAKTGIFDQKRKEPTINREVLEKETETPEKEKIIR